MTDYQKMYQEKLTTPDKIAQQVQSGWLLGMDTATSQTPAIMTAIAERIRNSDITGVKVQALLDAYPFEFYTDPTLAGKMTGYSWFSSSAARKAVNAGYADIIPAYYRDFPTRIRTEYDYDAVCVEVAPMDRHGYFSLALNGSYIDAMLDKTKRTFLEVNDRQPRGLCGSLIHISQVDAIVEYNHDLPVLPPVQLDEVSKTIGGLIAERPLGLLQHVRERPRIEPQQRRNADEQGQKTRRKAHDALHPAAVGKRGGQHGDHAHRHNGRQIAPDRLHHPTTFRKHTTEISSISAQAPVMASR